MAERPAPAILEGMPTKMVKQVIGGLEIHAYSLAGEESVITVPELNVAFDFGRSPRELVAIDNVCLSHGHMDHSAGIGYYFSQRAFLDNAPGCAIMHANLIPAVKNLLRAWAEIEGHPSPAKLVGLLPDQSHAIRKDLIVRAFAVSHPGSSLGFSVIEVRQKLKPEFAGLEGPQLVELKRKGIEIQYRLEIPRIAYCGDTTPGPFLDRPDVKNAEIMIYECTFLDDDHIERAKAGRHTHIKDLPEALRNINSPNIVLSHITRRTPMKQAKAMLKSALSKEIWDRVTILMERPPRTHAPQANDESQASA